MKIIKTLLVALLLVSWLLGAKSVMAAKCSAEKPDKAPDLFQIDVTKTSAKLYFAPVNNAITNYTIVYGYERLQNDFGVSFPFGPYEGVVNYTINDLNPNTKYYFRVRADNGCRQGWWSETMSVQTNWDFKIYTKIKEKPSLQLPRDLLDFNLNSDTVASVEGAMTAVPSPTVIVQKKIVQKEIKKFNITNVIVDLIKNLLELIKSF